MLSLIAKDFKLLFASHGSAKKRVLSAITSVLMIAVIIAIELFLFTTILKNVRQFNNASLPILTLFLFVISCLMILINTVRANQLFFNPKDIEQLVRRPVSNGQIVASKLIFLFASHYVMTFLLVYPILVAYGVLVGKTVGFYYIGIFYPVLSFIFEGGVALILVYPFKLLSDFLKKHMIVQFALALVLMVGGCIIYSRVLSLFMEMVVNNNINALFTKSSIDKLIAVKQYLVPINFLADAFFANFGSRLLFYICIAGGLFILGVSLTVFSFSYLRAVAVHARAGKVRDQLKITNPIVALIKKELFLLFKDSNNILSFTGLLIIQPFLVYVIINAINSVLFSGKLGYQMMAFPAFVPLVNVLIIMLFTLIINQGANEYIQSEKGNVRVMKTIPVCPLLQLAIKVVVPFVLSTLSLGLTVIVLAATGLLAPMTALCSFFMTWILLAIFILISLKEEMRVSNNKPRSTWLSTCYSYLLPFSFFAISLVGCWNGMPLGVAYLIGFLIFILSGVPHVINIKRKMEDLFLDLEMVN
ncbi:MAG: hypothetical protein IJW29_08590 [Clostridia bacterium]|nr:hypothetical protein [Clostridia bacterium]